MRVIKARMRRAKYLARMGEMIDAYRVLVENLKKEATWEDLGVNGKILKLIFNRRNRDMGWIDLAQNKDRWRALVNTIINIWVQQNGCNFLIS